MTHLNIIVASWVSYWRELFEGYKRGGSGGHTPSIIVVADEVFPVVVSSDTRLAEELGTLFTVSSGLFLVAVLIAVLLGAKHLLKQLVELQEVVDEGGGLVSRVGCWLVWQ